MSRKMKMPDGGTDLFTHFLATLLFGSLALIAFFVIKGIVKLVKNVVNEFSYEQNRAPTLPQKPNMFPQTSKPIAPEPLLSQQLNVPLHNPPASLRQPLTHIG